MRTTFYEESSSFPYTGGWRAIFDWLFGAA